MGANDKVAATFHPWTERQLVDLARAWPADETDRTIIHDLADALELRLDEAEINPGVADLFSRPSVFEVSPDSSADSGQEVTANDPT